MTARERVLVYIIGVLALVGIGYVAFTSFVKPIREENAKIDKAQADIYLAEAQLGRDVADNQRLLKLAPYSLPADRELAVSEYQSMLERLMHDSGIIDSKNSNSTGKATLQTQSDTDPEPELAPNPTPGKPPRKTYSKVIFTLTFEKVNLLKLTDFLTRYYKAPLLHQITKCTIKHATSGGTATNSTKLKADERNDLTVTLVTEAVLLDGAPDRKTLFPVPDTFGAALGGVGLNALVNDRTKARNLTPTPDPAFYTLADPKRDYTLLAARDPFHGPLPEYPPLPPVIKKDKEEGPPLPPPPYDSTPFVKLTSLVVTSEGGKSTARADVFDAYYDQFYTVLFSQFGDLFEMKVQRFSRDLKFDPVTKQPYPVLAQDWAHPRGGVLEIADRAAKEVRTYKVYGLNGNALILGEKEKLTMQKPEKAKAPAGRPQKGAKPVVAPPPLPVPDQTMIAVGGLAGLTLGKEKFYLWTVGQPLKSARLLNASEAKAYLDKAAKGLNDLTPIVVREIAPMPRRPRT